MQNTISTLQLEGWGYREMSMAAELLKQYADHGTGSVVGAEPQGTIALGFNPNSGNVYMTDEDFNCYMLNDDGEVEQWVYLSHSGEEGFLTEIINKEMPELATMNDDDLLEIEALQIEYDYLIKS